MTTSHRAAGPALPGPAPRSPWAVAGGVFAGLPLGFIVIPVAAILAIETLASGSGNGDKGIPFGILGVCVPLLVGVMLLVPRGVRRAGRGFVLGLASGMIAGSLICLVLVGIASSSYDGVAP